VLLCLIGSWSDQTYSKNKVFISIMTLSNFDYDLDYNHLVWWFLSTRYSYMLTMMILRWKTKKLEFLGKVKILRFDITNWCHNIKLVVYLKNTHQGLSYEVLHDMVLSISKFDLGYTIMTLVLIMKVKVYQPSKLISSVADNVLLSHQVWSRSDHNIKKKDFCLYFDLAQYWPWPLTFIIWYHDY
jgi:hypothetical protein